MGALLTIAVLAAVCGLKLLSASRRAAKADRRAAGEKERRLAGEAALRARVEQAKRNRDPLELAKRAVAGDPSRAAKTVSRMMKSD